MAGRRALAVWWVVMMLWVAVSMGQQLITTCPVELDQEGTAYELADDLTFGNEGEVCIKVTANKVLITGRSPSVSPKISYSGSSATALGIQILGEFVEVATDLQISRAQVEVRGKNASLQTLTLQSSGSFSSVPSEIVGLLIAADGVSVTGGSIVATQRALSYTGVKISGNDVSIGQVSVVVQGPGIRYVNGLVMDNVKDSYASISMQTIQANTAIYGARVSYSARVRVAVATRLIAAPSAFFGLVDIHNASYVDVTSDAPVLLSSNTTTGFNITASSYITVTGTMFNLNSNNWAYGATVESSDHVTFDALSLTVKGTTGSVVYGVRASQCADIHVINTDITIMNKADLPIPSKAYGIFVDGGNGIFENNTILLDASDNKVGINLTGIDIANTAFGNNDINDEVDAFIITPVTLPCSATTQSTAWACYPSYRYPCCHASTCLPDYNPTRLCRGSVGECDVSDYCTARNSSFCAPDAFQPPTTECGVAVKDCGPRDKCAGNSTECVPAPPPCIAARGPGICNANIHTCECADKNYTYPNCTWQCNDRVCDYAERCFEDCYPSCVARDCYPADGECCNKNTCQFRTDTCRPSVAPCDAPEDCPGNNVTCPPDVLYLADVQHICNRSDACTKPSTCDGTSLLCPPLTQVECGGFCGDGICQVYESCKSCFFDCASQCPILACPGNPPCTGHGECNQGVCFCHKNYTGPICAESSVPVNVTHNDTNTNIKTENVSFEISISRVFELNLNDGVEAEYVLAGREFAGTHENLNVSERWNTSAQLPNKASLRLTSWIFYQATEIQFANITVPLANYTLKNLVRVTNWPFVKLQNRLVFEYIIANTDPNACVSTNFQLDENNNVMYFSFQSGSVSLYCQLVRTIILDGKFADAQFRVEGNRLQVIVPHFWISVEVDPNFSVLVDDDKGAFNTRNNSCDRGTTGKRKNNVDGILLAKILAPIAGVCLIAAVAVAVIYPRIHTWYMTKKGKEHLGSQLDSSPSFDADQSYYDDQT